MLRVKIGKFAMVWRPENKPHTGRRLAFAFLLMATLVYAGVPNTFKDGDTLTATQLNDNFNSLSARLDAMEGKSWRLICEIDFNSATTSTTTTAQNCNINGDADKEYQIFGRFIPGGAGCGINLQFNGDTGANYGYQRSSGTNAAASANRATAQTSLNMASGSSPNLSTFHGYMFAQSGYARVYQTFQAEDISGTSVTTVGNQANMWSNSGANITSMTITGVAANCIGAGSHIEIWARR